MFGKKKDVTIGNVLRGALAPATKKPEEFDFCEFDDAIWFGVKKRGGKK